jgi:ATP-binding cassette subfamily B (MDR/TAP) protein 1
LIEFFGLLYYFLQNEQSMASSMVQIQAAIGRQVADTFASIVSALGSLTVALLLNGPLALVMLAVVPVIGLIILIISCFLRQRSHRAAESYAEAGALATEVIAGIKTVASLCAERWALTTYDNHIREGQKHSVYGGFLTSLIAGLTGLFFYVTYVVAFSIGTYQVEHGMRLLTIVECLFSDEENCRVSGAAVMCCIYGVILTATFFGMMAPGLQAINLARQAAAHIFATIDRTPTIDMESSAGDTLDTLKGGITLEHIEFAYPSRPSNRIFADLNLKINPGSTIAFVGPSGSGKSTITKLLLRFYVPSYGRIMIDDGIPLDDLNLAWWRSQIGYVAQTPTLFPGTIHYNIACGKPGATKDEVVAASKAACCHDFIMALEGGYDCFFSGTSMQLSGGQLQRLAIARAIIRVSIILCCVCTRTMDYCP